MGVPLNVETVLAVLVKRPDVADFTQQRPDAAGGVTVKVRSHAGSKSPVCQPLVVLL
jgi:hypothetical protein